MHNQHKLFRVFKLIQLLKADPPKHIRYLGDVIESTDRTVYRYLELLGSVGFSVKRDRFNRVFIEDSNKTLLPSFTSEERALLIKLLQTTATKSKLHDSLMRKIAVEKEHVDAGDHLLSAHLSAIIDQLQTAIREHRVVMLKSYHSVHSNTIADRKVEPIAFTKNFQSVLAYEPASDCVKVFNTERITQVVITTSKFKNTANHTLKEVDPFGFAGKQSFRVRLLLTMRASVLLKENYPLTAPLIHKDRKKGFFKFDALVYDLKPIAHFVLGFPDDVSVLEGEPLKTQIKFMVKRLLDK